MKKFVQITTVATLLIAASVSVSLAAPTSKMAPAKKAAAVKVMKCPVCGMPMPKTKSAMMTEAVYSKANKTVYYCCPVCKAGKAAAAYDKKHKGGMPV